MRTRWSQNFLIDKNIARICVEALDPGPGDSVVEIGPGRGVLTELLLEKTKCLTVVEIDPRLCDLLKEKFGRIEGFGLIRSDFLRIDEDQISKDPSKKWKVIGNLPYAVVSPILQKLLGWRSWETAVVMVQKEVGERITAEPGTRDYGVLSVSVQSRCRIEKIRNVSKGSFRPVPKVESSVLRLTPLAKPVFNPGEEKRFFTVVKASFSHRRKTILNSIGQSLNLPEKTVKSAVERLGLSTRARAETFSARDFKRLTDILYNP